MNYRGKRKNKQFSNTRTRTSPSTRTRLRTTPCDLITCCSVLQPGQKHYKARFRTCTALRVGKECMYSHEPQMETEQSSSTQQT